MEGSMSPAKTVYIRDEDAPIWQRAEETAERTRQSVSQLVAGALRHYLPTIHTPDDEMESIRVKVGDRVTPLPDTVASPADYSRTEEFTGRWLVPPGEGSSSRYTKQTTGYCYAVALTRRGQIAVYRYHPKALRASELEAFASLEDADLPPDIEEKASGILGKERVIWRDI
jgi:hypothetical protein